MLERNGSGEVLVRCTGRALHQHLFHRGRVRGAFCMQLRRSHKGDCIAGIGDRR